MAPTCQRCSGGRVVSYTAKTSDMNHFSLGEKIRDGYVPDDLGVGGGDYVEFDYCLDCGQLQGYFPLAPTELETKLSAAEYIERVLSSPDPFNYRDTHDDFDKMSEEDQRKVVRRFDGYGLRDAVARRKRERGEA